MQERLIMVGIGVGALLAVLGLVFFYLRLDHATRGFHSGRLQMMSLAVLATILGVCYFLWTKFLLQ